MTHNQSCAGEEDSAVGVLRIRAMNPEDIDQVVGLHLDCFEGHLLVSLGARLLRLYYQAMLAEPATVMASADSRNSRLIRYGSGAQKRSHTTPGPATAVKAATPPSTSKSREKDCAPAAPRRAPNSRTAATSKVTSTAPAREVDAMTLP